MAQENFTPVPNAQPTGPAGQLLHVDADANAFGAGVARAISGTGQALEGVAQNAQDVAVQFKQMQNATDALNTSTAASRELGDAEMQFRALQGNDAVTGLPNFQKKVQDIQAKYAGQLQGNQAQLKFLEDFRNIADRSLFNAGIYVADQAKTAHMNSLTSIIKEDQSNIVRYTHSGQEPDLSSITDHTLMLAQERGLDKDSAHALLQSNIGQAMHDAVIGRIAAGDMPGAAAMFNKAMGSNVPGTELPLIDAGHQATLSLFLVQHQYMEDSRKLAIETRNLALADKQLRDSQARNFGSLYARALSGQDVPTVAELAQAANTQKITPQMSDAIIATASGRRGVTDDPAVLAPLLSSAYKAADNSFPDTVATAISNRQITPQTGDSLLKTYSAKAQQGENAVERAAFYSLRTIAGGDAVEKGMVEFGDQAKTAQIQLWAQAQNEWTQRVLVNREDPTAVLADMSSRYSHPVQDIRALPAPRMGHIGTLEDAVKVATDTASAHTAGQMDDSTFNAEKALIVRYQSILRAQEGQREAAAAAKARKQTGTGVKPQ